MGLLVNHDKSGNSSIAKNDSWVLANEFRSKGNGVLRPDEPYGPPIYGLGEGEYTP